MYPLKFTTSDKLNGLKLYVNFTDPTRRNDLMEIWITQVFWEVANVRAAILY